MLPLIRASSLRGFGDLVRELGGDPATLLTRFGMSLAVLDNDDELVPITDHDRMLDAAADELDCPDLGLRLAARQDLSILGPVAHAISLSQNATEAIECVTQFLFVHSPALTIRLDDDPWQRAGVVALTYRKDLSDSPYSPQAVELGVGLFYRIALHLVGGSEGLRSVELPHHPMSAVDRYLDFFGTDVKFGRPVAALCVTRRALESAFGSADADHRAAAIAALATTYEDPSRLVSSQVRRVIAESPPGSLPQLAEVAARLGTHSRTLQRQLAAEGTTFAQVQDALRRDRALRLITTTRLSFIQVADLVGFSEQSTLSHACRRWFGLSPAALRQCPDLSR